MAEPWTPAAPAVAFVLTGAEFDVVWEHLGLGATPAALRLPSPGRTLAERRRIAEAGVGGLRARGLAGPSGPDPALVRLLVLLARPDRHLEVRGAFPGPLRAVAAERDGDGVLAVHTGGSVTVSAAGSPAHAAASALPRCPAGPGPALRVPTAALARLLDPGRRPAGTGVPGPGCDDERLTQLFAGPAHRAQVCAVRHDRWGSPARLPGHLAVVDTRWGRYRLARSTGPHGGPEWSTLAPAGERSLPAELDALFSPGRSAASADDPLR
ncbi:ESX secretion-associated protein EspG [Pseudonocardia spirodelae]|uniref:ESX secretion-associated protein EspG n=1 Tax=Pseudonocardia spirodelae TaxID=3133431 RepID=A0ABU8TE16_9PSEU